MSELKHQIKEILADLRHRSVAEIAAYDMKNDWIDPALPPWERLRLYYADEPRGQVHDCDVSLRSMVVSAIALGRVTETEHCYIGRQKCWDRDHWATEENKFCLCSPQWDWELRGDTMHSAATTLGALLESGGKAFLKNCSQGDWRRLPLSARRFLELYHTAGNFILVPFRAGEDGCRGTSFNCLRGLGPAKDYWDLTMLCHYHNFFCLRMPLRGEDMAEGYYPWTLLGEGNDWVCQDWLELFRVNGDGDESWYCFVADNHLQDFCCQVPGGDFGLPKELWDGHFAGKAMPMQKWQCVKFFENASAQIAARGQRVALAVKQEVDARAEAGLDAMAARLAGEE